MTLASASRRGLPEAAGFAPGVVNAAGLCSAVVGGTTGGCSGYCGCAWVCVCSYQSGAVCCDPSSGGCDDQGNCDGGCCWVPSGGAPSGPMPTGVVPSGVVPSGVVPSGVMGSGVVPSGGTGDCGAGCCVMRISLVDMS